MAEALSLTLRAARPEDYSAIAAVDAASSPEPFGASHLARYCNVEPVAAAALVASEGEDAANVCGFVLYSTVLDEGSIDNIAVLPRCRRAGLGGRLLDGALQAMRERGMRRCLLDVRQSNAAARALYTRHGFVEDGLRKAYYRTAGGFEDAVLMSRSL